MGLSFGGAQLKGIYGAGRSKLVREDSGTFALTTR